jgi:hypothetical protein
LRIGVTGSPASINDVGRDCGLWLSPYRHTPPHRHARSSEFDPGTRDPSARSI